MTGPIVVLNPNSSQPVTDAVDEGLEPLRFSGGPPIGCATLAQGPPAIESDEQVAAVVEPVCDYLRDHEHDSGAFVIACFSAHRSARLRISSVVANKPRAQPTIFSGLRERD